jgi:Fe-S oxidoreductase
MTSSERPISYQPTDGLTYDPEDAAYWQRPLLDREITRVFEICHGCRMCFKFCDSFPTLFRLLDDDAHAGDVRTLAPGEVASIMGQCFQCKLCEVQCPYTPRDHHEYQVDFPKLVHRYQAVQARARGVRWRDRVLADPDRAGAAARASLGLANTMNRVSAHRWLMEKTLGIHRDKLLPPFAPSTFERWAEQTGRLREGGRPEGAPQGGRPEGAPQNGSPEVVLFQTCYVQNNEPQIGRDTVEVLERSQVSVACVRGLRCCGMPAWEHGDLDTLRASARANLDILMPHVQGGARVLAINPTCAMMMRREYPELVAAPDRERARALAAAVQDPGEFLWSIRREPRFARDFKTTPARVAYHAPCHLRAQAVGFRGRDLLRQIPGVSVQSVLECCGHDGTYAMKVESFEASRRIGQKAFTGMDEAGGEVWVTECPLAAVQFAQHAGVKALHPMTVLARAYRADGFPAPAPPPAAEAPAAPPPGEGEGR